MPPAIANSVNSTHAVFLYDSNGKYLNMKKMFPSNKDIEYFRCPAFANARAILHNDLLPKNRKHIKPRHIRLLASNLIAAIRGRTRKMRQVRLQSSLRTVSPKRLISYWEA